MDNELINQTIRNLEKNNFTVRFFEDSEAAVNQLMEELKKAKSISRSGSVTIDSLGIIDRIHKLKLPFRDYASPEDRRASITADVYLTGTNAITMDGKLVNIDGCGNRVSAMSYGPNKIFILCGTNKIVRNFDEAIHRIETVAAPRNAKRLNRNTPCVKTGHCSDCNSNDRICRKTLIINKPILDRIHIYLINQELGY